MLADLVLGGGGVMGIALVGAISVLEERAYQFQRVVDAVRASASVPFFYKSARLTDADGGDCWLVDGAMLSRFPIDVFDAPPGLEPRWPTSGIKLGVAPGPITEVHNTASMSRAMLNAMTGFCDRRHVDDVAARAYRPW